MSTAVRKLLSRAPLAFASRLMQRDFGRASGCRSGAESSPDDVRTRRANAAACKLADSGVACVMPLSINRWLEVPGRNRWPRCGAQWTTCTHGWLEHRSWESLLILVGNFTAFLNFYAGVSCREFTFYDKMREIVACARKCRAVTLLTAVLLGTGQHAGAVDLPSGLQAELHEVLVDRIGSENWVRFRFLAPAIDRASAGSPGFAEMERDFAHLCATLAVPYLAAYDLEADTVVISIADRIIEFGVSDPDATQYFEQFRIEGSSCIWEAF